MKRLLTLIRIFVLRNVREEKFLTSLSILGVALGIGLFIGVKVASDRALVSFESGIQGLNPRANYEIIDISGIDFDERVYREVLHVEERILPLLKVNGNIPSLKDTIDINGLYTVKALRFLPESAATDIDVEQFFRKENGILVSKKFAGKHGLKRGAVIHALVYDKEYPLEIVDVLDAEQLPANTVIMDLGNFQEYFRKWGLLSRIDLETDAHTAERLQRMLPPNLSLERKEEVIKSQESLVASFRYNLQFISLIAILVGVFLLYNTVFISVVKRRTEIGILRSLGADKDTVIFLFTIQGILLGFIGSVIGIGLGQIIAYFSVIAVERTISTMYGTIAISDYLISMRDALRALGLGLLISLIASAVPAFEASRIRPNESSKEGTFESKYRKYQGVLALAGLFCIGAGGVLSYIDYRYTPFEFPFLAYLGILSIIAGFSFLSPFYLSLVLKMIRTPSERLLKATAKITIGDMKGNIYRFSVSLMSVAISGALIVALLTLIFSFKKSLESWIARTISADIYIKPASCTSNFCFYPLSEEVVSIVQSFPEVAGVDRFRTLHLDLFGRKVVAGFGDIEMQRRHSKVNYFDIEEEGRFKELGQRKQVAISNYLSIKYGLREGDPLEIQTPKGKQAFIVNDTFSSYSTTSGFIYMDRKWLKEYWGLDDATQMAVYVKKGTDVDRFAQKLRAQLSTKYSLEVMNSSELRDKVLTIFNRSFAITYAIELISIVVSLIGVINTLLALVLERKRDISIIRYLGGDWRQIQCMLIFAAGIIGIAGTFLGTLMGPLMSIIFIHVVNKVSFGWEIHFSIPVLFLSFVIIFLLATTVLAGIIPSKVARKIDPKRFISFE
ncbi:MAG: ABC transporter permease [Nitrospirota bacterium]